MQDRELREAAGRRHARATSASVVSGSATSIKLMKPVTKSRPPSRNGRIAPSASTKRMRSLGTSAAAATKGALVSSATSSAPAAASKRLL